MTSLARSSVYSSAALPSTAVTETLPVELESCCVAIRGEDDDAKSTLLDFELRLV